MAIRIRKINGVIVALCAAKTFSQPGDIYLDDRIHHALSTKFALDFNSIPLNVPIPFDFVLVELTLKEEIYNN